MSVKPVMDSWVSAPHREPGCSPYSQAARPALRWGAFTLLELLVVIAIIGIVAAMSVPAIKNMQKADAIAAGTRQMQDALARARQFAISQRTTVYMVFVPVGFWPSSPTPSSDSPWAALLEKQLSGYNFFSLRGVGDQPGQNHPRYLDEWRALPEGIFIPEFKFNVRNSSVSVADILDASRSLTFRVYGFARNDASNPFPFPTATNTFIPDLPYIAFNHLGQMVSDLDEEIIPLARGSVAPSVNADKVPQFNLPTITEKPPGNSTNNAFTLIVVDRLTGRAHVERQKIQ